ncbi:MAG: FtsX-like permease family protein, partial [Chloroflexota bacterium]
MIRWKKVYRDLWNNRSRTILVILSIAVGVFAIGLISATRQALVESLNAQFVAIQPADIILKTEPGLSRDFVSGIRNMRGVREAEGRRSLALRISMDGKGETWRDLTVYSMDDYNDQRLFLVHQQDGIWPPEKGQVLLERASMDYIGVQPGDQILVKTPGGREFNLQVTGRVHDLYRIPPIIEGWIFGYVSKDTLRWMGESDQFNELYLSAQEATDILTIADKAAKRIEGQGLPVYQKTIPNSGEHPLGFIIQTMLILLGLVAVMGMLLSALFVINIISALIAQQERQIGIMKAVGAQSSQIIFLYYGMVLIIGGLACAIAIPGSNLAADTLTAFVAKLINFNPPVVNLTWPTFLIQAGCGLLIPLCAATPTILSGTRISPASVWNDY